MQPNETMKGGSKDREIRAKGAFTLIELLTVIAIIGVLAALIVPLSGVATAKMRVGRVQAELNNLTTMIESYRYELGGYPPDHGLLSRTKTNEPLWRVRLQRSPLYYELSGAVFTNNLFRVMGTREDVTPPQLTSYFGVNGVQNSARAARDIPYRAGSFQTSDYKELDELGTGMRVKLLAVPAPGPSMLKAAGGGGTFNTWFYDASSTNRHNLKSYDLWAEVNVRGQVQVIGNWAQ